MGGFHRFDNRRIVSASSNSQNKLKKKVRLGGVLAVFLFFNGESRVTHPLVVQQVRVVSAEYELSQKYPQPLLSTSSQGDRFSFY